MRQLYTVLFLFAFVSVSMGQEVRFGFTTSPVFGLANVDAPNAADEISYTDDTEGRTGFAYGVLLDYDFNGEDRYFLHSGLTMHHTGFDVVTDGGMGDGPTSAQVNVDYIEIPLALKLRTNDIGYLRYYGQFGLNNGIKVGEKVKEGVESPYTEIKTLNVGLNMGGGVEYNISDETSAVAGLYYNNGFSNVADNSAGSFKNNQLGIRLGVYF